SRCIAISSHLFLPSIPRPTRSTLFPYTTLFRSRHDEIRNQERNRTALLARRGLFQSGKQRQQNKNGARKQDLPLEVAAVGKSCLDRKSTRLNSSHGSISYAVFCLKKKNKTKPEN